MKTTGFKITLTIFLLLAVGFFTFVIYWVWNNAVFLRFNVPKNEIIRNNENIIIEDENDFLALSPQKLKVADKYKIGALKNDRVLNLPQGFEISVFAAGLSGPRFFDFDEEDNMIVADKGAGKIFLLKDNDSNGTADDIIEVDKNLKNMHSVFFYKNDLFAAEEHQVIVFRNFKTDGTYSKKEILVPNLPVGSGHSTRTVVIGPDEKMYVSVGSSCNLCEEKDKRRAAVVRYNLNGLNEEIFAYGLRNSVGIEFKDNELWSVENGRDRIGDDLPPEEVNIVKQDKHYGWPYCHGRGIQSPEYKNRGDFCKNETEYPKYEMQAHSAPLGMAFLLLESQTKETSFPESLKENLFIGFHGSWNRTVPTGYKIVRIDTSSDTSPAINFITGWLEENGQAWGRPVDVGFDTKGVMYVSDDKAGVIYRIIYK